MYTYRIFTEANLFDISLTTTYPFIKSEKTESFENIFGKLVYKNIYTRMV